MAEQLGLEHRARQRGAVHRDQRAGAARQLVDRVCDQLSARTDLAADLDRRVRRRRGGEGAIAIRERCVQRGQIAGDLGRIAIEVGLLGRGAEQQRGVTDQDRIAVLERLPLDPIRTDGGAVPGVEIFEHPPATDP